MRGFELVAAVLLPLPDGLLDLLGYRGASPQVGFYIHQQELALTDGTDTWVGTEFVHGAFFHHPVIVERSLHLGVAPTEPGWWWVANRNDNTLGFHPEPEARTLLGTGSLPSGVIDLDSARRTRLARTTTLFCTALRPEHQQHPGDLFDQVAGALYAAVTV